MPPRLNPFESKGRWFKGSLHCHTTNSDGILPPVDVARAYAENGYDFVVFTDHGKVTSLAEDNGGVLPVGGEELSVGRSKAGESYHVIAIGIEGELRAEGGDGPESVQEVVDDIADSGGLAFIAHPYWSGLVPEDMVCVKGYLGIEVFNTGCEAEVGKGFSIVHWDQVLSLGRMVKGVAVDDAHRYLYPPYDAFGGWVWVRADELEWGCVAKAIGKGLFYSSMGPKITLVELGKTLRVKCSGAKQVSMISHNGSGMVFDYPTVKSIVERRKRGEKDDGAISSVDFEYVDGGMEAEITLRNGRKLRGMSSNEGIIEAECDLGFFNRYVRIEVVDKENRKAWTNPLPLGAE
ncbi:MAG: PHP domain-containing protein [Candidatus Brockarchaeota archaeon]|nr:PHP domain-containing protein [Candidatus Brockarchaeota archaeon]